MRSSGYVLREQVYKGSDSPPDSFIDESRFGNDGTHTSITWVREKSGLWVRDLNGTSSKIAFGDIGLGKAVMFWLYPDSTTEAIMEEVAATGIEASSGTLSYSGWDNAYVKGIDTNTIIAGWQHITIVSTTYVTMSAFTVGLLDATYLDGKVALLKVFEYAPDETEIGSYWEKERHWFEVI